jgi:signal transduction histidine kinase
MMLRGITGKITGKTEETLNKADHRTGNLLNIIDEMIDYAYMKSEKEIQYEKSDIRLREMIDYNVDLFSYQAKQRDIRLVSTCSGDLTIRANRDLVNIILSNLITNALKYSHPESTVTINGERTDGEIHLLIKDEGIGIEPAELDNIFEEFYRTRRARERERDGTGLGLSIVKRSVTLLNGNLTVYSEVGKGTTFHIYLPARGGENGG